MEILIMSSEDYSPVESAAEAPAKEDFLAKEYEWRYCLWDLLDETLWGIAFVGIGLFVYFYSKGHAMEVCTNACWVTLFFAVIFWPWALLRKASNTKKMEEEKKKCKEGEKVRKPAGWKTSGTLFFWAVLMTVAAGTLAVFAFTSQSDTVRENCSKGVLCGYGTLVAAYWFWLGYQAVVRRCFVVYKLTGKQFIYKYGFLVAHEIRFEIWDIEQVNMSANLWQRMLGVGQVELTIKDQKYTKSGVDIVTSAGSGDMSNLKLPGLKNPSEVQNTINSYRMYVRTEVLNSVVNA